MNDNIKKEFPIIETERLMLRKLNISDREALFEIFSSEEIMKYYGMFPLKEINDAENLISNLNKAFIEDRSIRWGIVLKEENRLIGTCGYHNWNKAHNRAEIGYELFSKYWRKGYITESIKGILLFGFEEMNLNRIEALVYPENIPSHKSLLKLGFIEEGVLREYALFRERHQDLMMYSLLKKNFS